MSLRRSDGTADLPPGQHPRPSLPRFTDRPHRPPPPTSRHPHLKLTLEGSPLAIVSASDLQDLSPQDHRADFHCVTTWSVQGLTWTGVVLREVLASVGIEGAPAPFLRTRAADGRRGALRWDDAIAPDVVLATHLNGEVLGARHGGPLRLVAPRHYGYKSVKHLVSIDFRADEPRLDSKEHLRGRVAREERHPKLPNWLVRPLYRILIPPTAYLAERSLRRGQADQRAVRSC